MYLGNDLSVYKQLGNLEFKEHTNITSYIYIYIYIYIFDVQWFIRNSTHNSKHIPSRDFIIFEFIGVYLSVYPFGHPLVISLRLLQFLVLSCHFESWPSASSFFNHRRVSVCVPIWQFSCYLLCLSCICLSWPSASSFLITRVSLSVYPFGHSLVILMLAL